MDEAQVENFYSCESSKLVKFLHEAQDNDDTNLQKEILFQLAQLNYNVGKYSKARILLKKILNVDKSQVNVYYYLGLIDLEEKDDVSAMSNFKKELEVNPNNDFARKIIDKLNIKSNFPMVTILLFLINSIIFFLFSYPQIDLIFSIRYGLNYVDFNFFNLITALFFHINLLHYLTNMVMLLLFGFILEKSVGSIKFALIYILAGVTGIFFEVFLTQNIIIMGASAAIFGILGALMLLEPFLKIKVLGIFNVPIIMVLGGIFFVSMLISPFFDIGLTQGDISHLIGFLVGVLVIGILNNEKIGIFYNWIFIFFGFWFVKLGFDKIFLNQFLWFIILFLLGSFLIWYSYMTLKRSFQSF